MNYRYFEDLYNNEYRWSIQTNDDGYYSCGMYKFSSSNGWARYKQTKSRKFRKRNMAKSWCLKLVRKARARQQIVLDARADRKQARIDAKPTYSKLELEIIQLEFSVEAYKIQIKRAGTKMKSLTTRNKNMEKKIKSKEKMIFNRKQKLPSTTGIIIEA